MFSIVSIHKPFLGVVNMNFKLNRSCVDKISTVNNKTKSSESILSISCQMAWYYSFQCVCSAFFNIRLTGEVLVVSGFGGFA